MFFRCDPALDLCLGEPALYLNLLVTDGHPLCQNCAAERTDDRDSCNHHCGEVCSHGPKYETRGMSVPCATNDCSRLDKLLGLPQGHVWSGPDMAGWWRC